MAIDTLMGFGGLEVILHANVNLYLRNIFFYYLCHRGRTSKHLLATTQQLDFFWDRILCAVPLLRLYFEDVLKSQK